jgi:hypothetical protein
VATKRGKQSGNKATKTKPGKTSAAPRPGAKPAAATARPAPVPAKTSAAPRPSAKPAPAATRAPERRGPVAVPVAAPVRREVAPPSLLERAKALRDSVQQSKLTARDPWGYTAKARAWQERIEQLLDRITANVDAAAAGKSVEALRTEIEGDRDYQEALRRA